MSDRPAVRSLWRHPDFRRLWVGDTASQLGFALGSLAIPYLAVTTLHATQFQMGLLTALAGLGFLVVGLPAGALIDRRSKRAVMITADLARAALLATLPIAWWFGVLGFGQLMVVATAVGIFTVFFDVSYQSYLPLLVDSDQVVEGNGKLQASQSVSQAAGPAIGGVLLTRSSGRPRSSGSTRSATWRRPLRSGGSGIGRSRRPRRTGGPLVTEIGEGLAVRRSGIRCCAG